MFKIKYTDSPIICINIRFDIIKLNNKRHMVPVTKNAANFVLLDKSKFDPTRSLKLSNKLHKCIRSAEKVDSGLI